MKVLRAFLVTLILTAGLSPSARAQTDVSIGLVAQPNSGLVPGQPIVFTLTVTNNGPEAVPAVGSGLALYSSDIYDEFDASSGSTDCLGYTVIITDGDGFSYANLVWYPTLFLGILDTGETRSCHITLALSNQAPEEWPFSFRISDSFQDVNPSNNVATVILRRGDVSPVVVPALSLPALLLLSALLALMAWVRLWKRRTF